MDNMQAFSINGSVGPIHHVERDSVGMLPPSISVPVVQELELGHEGVTGCLCDLQTGTERDSEGTVGDQRGA